VACWGRLPANWVEKRLDKVSKQSMEYGGYDAVNKRMTMFMCACCYWVSGNGWEGSSVMGCGEGMRG